MLIDHCANTSHRNVRPLSRSLVRMLTMSVSYISIDTASLTAARGPRCRRRPQASDPLATYVEYWLRVTHNKSGQLTLLLLLLS
mgnify:FL=1